ncbi:SIR2 family protein [Aeoliella sp. ICT_H6.2]|uniref:SIR2 family protein n=1 Tax=Aeoliella straminimaris TaxID=2954799 RepID=A0A9X2FDD1_9BACT|nr:SIR2 family protein [Aeoliella straminimaris]MCO6046524.1 SIR2 family protein [Aeoliella straminimaris]
MAENLQKSDCAVFLLGAGASVHLGLPVMVQFLDEARRRYFDEYADEPSRKLEWDSLGSLLSFHAECQASTWALERDWNNLEELYTQADLQKAVATATKKGMTKKQNLCKELAWAIWDVYRAPRGKVLSKTMHNSNVILNRVRNSKLKPIFITTNYDLGIEQGLLGGNGNVERFAYPGFRPSPNQRVSFTGSDNALELQLRKEYVPVIKLHGSVNWERDGKNTVAWCTESVDPETRKPTLELAMHRVPRSRLIENGPFNEPLIVPPALSKMSPDKAVLFQWQAAVDAFTRARELWIVGYSFPATDPFMLRLLHEGLSKNSQLERVSIIDISSQSDWRPKLAMFNQTFNSRRIRYYSMKAAQFFSLAALVSTDWSEIHAQLMDAS